MTAAGAMPRAEVRAARVDEVLALGLFCGLEIALGVRVLTALDGGLAFALFVLAAGLGWLATDLVSGLVHWACDSCLEEDTPVVGRALIRAFREHHRDPQRMVRRPWFEVNHSNCLAILPFLGVGVSRGGPEAGDLASFAGYAWLLWFGAACYVTNTFHRWAHAPAPPHLARLLQHARIAIQPDRHARHHVCGDGAYCVTTGWLNPLLDRFGVWHALERLLAARAPAVLAAHRLVVLASPGPVAPAGKESS